MYGTEGVFFSRTSTDKELQEAFEMKKTQLRELQKKHHPEKNIGKEDTVRYSFEETTTNLYKLLYAHGKLLSAGKNGM